MPESSRPLIGLKWITQRTGPQAKPTTCGCCGKPAVSKIPHSSLFSFSEKNEVDRLTSNEESIILLCSPTCWESSSSLLVLTRVRLWLLTIHILSLSLAKKIIAIAELSYLVDILYHHANGFQSPQDATAANLGQSVYPQ